MNYFRVKVIDFQNDSISVALPFNKELYNRVSSKTGLRVLILEQKSKIITFYPKISYEGEIFKISNWMRFAWTSK